MDNRTPITPPELDAALDTYYSAPQPDPAFADRLERQLLQRYSEKAGLESPHSRPERIHRRTFMQTLRARPALAILAALLALLTITGVTYALGRFAGFIPGFGFTSEGGALAVLSEPVEASQEGITLRVIEAVSDSDRFWVALEINGASMEEIFPQAYIQLPSGDVVQYQIGGATSPANSNRIEYTFPALPAETNAVTLLAQNVAGQNFTLGLSLRPAGTADVIPSAPALADRPQSANNNGIRLVLDHAAATASHTIFQVSLHSDAANTWIAAPWGIQLSDDAGRVYPLTDITPDTLDRGDTRIFETVTFTGTEQLALTLLTFPDGGDSLPVFEDFSAATGSFTFDPGPNPQAGQSLALDEDVNVGRFQLHAVRATILEGSEISFEFEGVNGINGLMLYTPDPLLRGSTGGVSVDGQSFTAGLTFESLPAQPFEVQVTRVYYTAAGSWTVEWQPPAATGIVEPTTTPQQVATTTPTQVSSDPVLLEVQELAQQFDAPLRQGTGWVHVVTETLTDLQAGQNYPPPYLRSELWYEVDAEGYVLRNVWLDYNENGVIIQQTATVGDYSINFTTGDSGVYSAPRYQISMDMLTGTLANASKSSTQVIREEGTCDNGVPCLIITLKEPFDEPAPIAGEEQVFYGAGQRTWIDRDTGQQVKRQSFWLLEDGSESVTSTSTVTLVEKMDTPPQEILDILARVVVP